MVHMVKISYTQWLQSLHYTLLVGFYVFSSTQKVICIDVLKVKYYDNVTGNSSKDRHNLS